LRKRSELSFLTLDAVVRNRIQTLPITPAAIDDSVSHAVSLLRYTGETGKTS
jgi:hypothetical protein